MILSINWNIVIIIILIFIGGFIGGTSPSSRTKGVHYYINDEKIRKNIFKRNNKK